MKTKLKIKKLISILEGIPPADVRAVSVMAELLQMEETGALTTEKILERQGEINEALKALSDHIDGARNINEMAARLVAVPGEDIYL